MRFEVKFPQLDIVWDKMAVGFEVVRRKALLSTAMLQNKEYLPVDRRCDVEIVHRFVPHRHLGAWHVAALSPGVRFAFHNYRRVFTAKIKTVHLLGFANTDWHGEAFDQRDALLRKKGACCCFKVVAGLSVACRTNSLKVID